LEYYPIFIDLKDKFVLVIGQYRILEFKIEKLIQAGAKIKYISNFLSDKIEKYIKSGEVLYYNDTFDEKYLNDIWLVVCGSDDAELKKQIAQTSTKRNILCNFVDEAPISSFISPSVFSKGDITIAISTKGKSPALNKYIKNEIISKIGDEYIYFTEMLGRLRHKVIDNISDQKTRSDLFETIVQNPEILDLIKRNKNTQAEQLVIELINKKIDQQKMN
jgi:precorrin-2 dehydrogenase/sirohydrochlorin ferrochelatase